jgi:hypothetical protein
MTNTPTPTCTCPFPNGCDINTDGTVDPIDLLLLVEDIRADGHPVARTQALGTRSDFNLDGRNDRLDLFIFLQQWKMTEPRSR